MHYIKVYWIEDLELASLGCDDIFAAIFTISSFLSCYSIILFDLWWWTTHGQYVLWSIIQILAGVALAGKSEKMEYVFQQEALFCYVLDFGLVILLLPLLQKKLIKDLFKTFHYLLFFIYEQFTSRLPDY